MSDPVALPEEPKLVGKKWDDKLARNIEDFLRKVRQFGGQIPRHAATHMVGGGDALPLDKLTKKGDLLTKTAVGYARLGVGTDGDVLTADSSEATGLKWDTSGGGGGSSDDAMIFAFFTGD